MGVDRSAIKRNTQAHPVLTQPQAAGLQQGGRAVAQTHLSGQVARVRMKRGQLCLYAIQAIGVAEMGHHRDLLHLSASAQSGVGAFEALGGEAQAVHAGVHFQKDPMRLVGFVAREPLDLRLTVHGVPEFEARALLEFTRIKDPFE